MFKKDLNRPRIWAAKFLRGEENVYGTHQRICIKSAYRLDFTRNGRSGHSAAACRRGGGGDLRCLALLSGVFDRELYERILAQGIFEPIIY